MKERGEAMSNVMTKIKDRADRVDQFLDEALTKIEHSKPEYICVSEAFRELSLLKIQVEQVEQKLDELNNALGAEL